MPADMDRFMNNVRMRLHGATDDLIKLELFNVCDEFFKASKTWQEDIDVFIPANDPAGTIYYLVPSGPSLIDQLMWVYQAPTQPNQYRGPQVLDVSMSVPGEFMIGTQPSSAVTYRVTVALTVDDPIQRDGFVVFPAWVLHKYRDVLMCGLLGKMYFQKGKPWTDNNLAVLNTRLFNVGKARAAVDATKNNVYKAQPWRFPSSVGGGQRGRSSRWAPPQ